VVGKVPDTLGKQQNLYLFTPVLGLWSCYCTAYSCLVVVVGTEADPTLPCARTWQELMGLEMNGLSCFIGGNKCTEDA